MAAKIPLLDLTKIGLDKSEEDITLSDLESVGADLRKAISGYGFAYLLGHGLVESFRKEVLDNFKRFFEDFDHDEKQKAFPRDPATLHGWVPPNLEQLDKLKKEDGEVVGPRTIAPYSTKKNKEISTIL